MAVAALTAVGFRDDACGESKAAGEAGVADCVGNGCAFACACFELSTYDRVRCVAACKSANDSRSLRSIASSSSSAVEAEADDDEDEDATSACVAPIRRSADEWRAI